MYSLYRFYRSGNIERPSWMDLVSNLWLKSLVIPRDSSAYLRSREINLSRNIIQSRMFYFINSYECLTLASFSFFFPFSLSFANRNETPFVCIPSLILVVTQPLLARPIGAYNCVCKLFRILMHITTQKNNAGGRKLRCLNDGVKKHGPQNLTTL